LYVVRCTLYVVRCADWNFECVGTWRDGAHTYLVSRLLTSLTASSLATPATDYFRCFVRFCLVRLKQVESNFVRGEIADRCCPLVNHKYVSFSVGWGVQPPKSSHGVRNPHVIQCVLGPHKCACKCVKRCKHGARVWQTTDRRQTTDHAMEKWLAIGEIACARAISPKAVASIGDAIKKSGSMAGKNVVRWATLH